MIVYRIGKETRRFRAVDLSGAGAAAEGARWNDATVFMLYTSTTRALACLETLVHIAEPSPLPLDRFLLDIEIPDDAWATRAVFDVSAHPGWDALPESVTATTWGTTWANSQSTLLAEVPSIVIPEEKNILINPIHPDFSRVRLANTRKWTYDPRL